MTHPNIISGGNKARDIISKRAIDKYNREPSICITCGKKIEIGSGRISDARSKKFCNRSCSAKHNNKIRWARRRENAVCVECGEKLNRGSGKYCSYECSRSARKINSTNKTIDRMNSGEPVTGGVVRRIILSIREKKCTVCGLSEWLGKGIMLFVDHINGNPYDNRLDNLRLICPNCDAQTETYMAKNRGNGRWQRRKRYNEGKSS